MSELHVSHGQYYLTSEDVHGSDADENDDGTVDGLTMASPDAIEILTGTHTGTVDVNVRLLPGAPPGVDRDTWEVVVERSFSTTSGARRIWDTDNDSHEEFPTIPAGGTYRLRVHARGRDQARLEEGPEEHLLLIWPAPMSRGRTFNMDETGQVWLNPDPDAGGVDTSAGISPPPSPAPAGPLQRAPSELRR